MNPAKLKTANELLELSEILCGCRQGNQRAQRQLFEAFAPQVLTLCRRYETSHTGAKDLMQETFISAFAKIDQYDPLRGNFGAWINRIAINKALKSLRGSVKIIPIQETTLANQSSQEEILQDPIPEELMIQAIQNLPLGYRMVFNLFVLDNYSHKEIAAELKISIQTSKSQLSKAKAQLRKRLKPYLNTPSQTRCN